MTLAEELGHIKTHVKYPATRAQVVEACNNMSDAPTEDAEWVAKVLPEMTYNNPNEVVGALLTQV